MIVWNLVCIKKKENSVFFPQKKNLCYQQRGITRIKKIRMETVSRPEVFLLKFIPASRHTNDP